MARGCSLVQRTQTRFVDVRLVARLGNFLCATVASRFGSLDVRNLRKEMARAAQKTILWDDVASSAVAADENSVWVVAKSGTTIKHTKYHVDRAGFVAQIKTYCRWLEPGRAL
jgi:hypothetical protein